MPVKHNYDVNVSLNIQPLPNTGVALVGLLTSGNDSNYHVKTYYSVMQMANDYDENTSVYNLVEKAFDTDDFNGGIEVITAPNKDVDGGGTNTSVNPTSTGASVAANTTNRFVYALQQVASDGFNYVVDDNLSESDLEAVADYLYNNQRAALVTQLPSKAALNTLLTYSAKHHVQTTDKRNGVYAMAETSSRKPAIQTACRLAQYNEDIGGVDASKVGDLSEFQPDDDLSDEDIKAIEKMNGSAIVDNADMMMQLSGKSADGAYLDNFVNTKIVKDTFQYRLQRALNNIKTRTYSQATIDFLYTIADDTGQELVNKNFLVAKPKIDKLDMSQVNNANVEQRIYNGFNIHGQISGAIDSMQVRINLAE